MMIFISWAHLEWKNKSLGAVRTEAVVAHAKRGVPDMTYEVRDGNDASLVTHVDVLSLLRVVVT